MSENIANKSETTSALTGTIESHAFMHGMKPEYIQRLMAVAMFKQFKPDEIIFREGEPANRFYLIRHGMIALEFNGKSQAIHLPHIVADGEVLGWSWLFPPYYWHFSARAVAPTDAMFFYGTRLREQCEEDPVFGYDLMKRIAAIVIKRLDDMRSQ